MFSYKWFSFDTEATGNSEMSYFKFLLRESNERLKPTIKSTATLTLDSISRLGAIKTLSKLALQTWQLWTILCNFRLLKTKL